MTTPAIVWLVVGLVTATAVLAVLIALIRHLFVVGRAVSRFQQEVGPIAADIGTEAAARVHPFRPGVRAPWGNRPGVG